MNSLSKKIIAAALAILVLAAGVLLLGSCGKKTEEPETTGDITEAAADKTKTGLSAVVEETGILVYKDSELIQTIKFSDIKIESAVNLDFAKEHISFTDFNFDGKDDLCVAVSDKAGDFSYICFLYAEGDKPFVYNAELSAIKNISVNAEDKQIVSESKKDGEKIYTCYEWKDGVLKEIKEYDDGESVPANVSKAASENTIGTKKTTAKTTEPSSAKPSKAPEKTTSKPAETTKKNKPSTTKAPSKPDVTKATQPAESGVQYATGDIDDGWF